MAMNVTKIKKTAAFFLGAVVPVLCWQIGMIYYGLFGALGFFAGGLLVSVLIGFKLIDHPFRQMVEGDGIINFNIDSTGIITPFVVQVESPFIHGRLRNREIRDSFDRSGIFSLAHPVASKAKIFKAGQVIEGKHRSFYDAQLQSEGEVVKLDRDVIAILMDYKTLNKSRFGFYHFPAMIYNEQLGSYITKDWFASMETGAFAKHQVLYLNRKVEELTSAVRDFGRHVVETLRPATNLLKNGWVQIAIIIFVVVLIALFIKPVIGMVQGFSGQATSAISSVTGGAVTTP
jgi:hypothetical protein